MPNSGAEKPVVLFDGVCNLCNTSVQFIIDRDPRGVFRFVSLQSAVGVELLRRHGIPTGHVDSVALVEDGRVYTRSSAALRIASRLSGPWKPLSFLLIVPRPLRDAVYDWISSNRYRWFGTSETCRIPDPELRDRFLD